jgi:hypothetical protein
MSLHQANDPTSFVWHKKQLPLRFVIRQVIMICISTKVCSKTLITIGENNDKTKQTDRAWRKSFL